MPVPGLIPAQYPGMSQLLFQLIGANMNVTTDQIMTAIGPSAPTRYLIDEILVVNASVSLTTAEGGVYTGASKPSGGILVAAAQAYSGLDATTKGLALTLTALARGPQSTIPYVALSTAQGAAATADFYVFGRILTGL